MKLETLPPLPPYIRYALTVPQSVLFADLSLEGNRRSVFRRSMLLDYEPSTIVIDAGGAMSWNYDADETFTNAIQQPTILSGLEEFVHSIGSTSRALLRTAVVVGRPETRRPGMAADVLDDLRAYWFAYENHMTNLFTFWNAEALLSEELIGRLRSSGREAEVIQGLANYLRPSESNFFAIERRALSRLGARFRAEELTPSSPEVLAHIELFGFLLAPFNLGAPPSGEAVIERMAEITENGPLGPHEIAPLSLDSFSDLSGDLLRLARLAQRLTFWKTDRLDAFAQADAQVRSLYESAANLLDLELVDLFSMRSSEIATSLQEGVPAVDARELSERGKAYCLALHEGKISFYQPSKQASSVDTVGTGRLVGTAASSGVAEGAARVILTSETYGSLQPGEILVTTMTRPEMGRALDRAAAFVTDEGGLMSHAAIISREMNKPCVIATEFATSVIRDGMRVRVDGDAGTVDIVDGPQP